MSGLALARAAQKSGVQTRGVAFQAAIIASASKKVHKTLSSKGVSLLSLIIIVLHRNK